MDQTDQKYKPIKFPIVTWNEINDLSDELKKERGVPNVALTDTVAEAVKFYKESRKKAE